MRRLEVAVARIVPALQLGRPGRREVMHQRAFAEIDQAHEVILRLLEAALGQVNQTLGQLSTRSCVTSILALPLHGYRQAPQTANETDEVINGNHADDRGHQGKRQAGFDGVIAVAQQHKTRIVAHQ